jgi:hypothetical protein
LPGRRRLYLFGDLQRLNRFLSSLHWNVDPVSDDLNRNLVERALVLRLGGEPLEAVTRKAASP